MSAIDIICYLVMDKNFIETLNNFKIQINFNKTHITTDITHYLIKEIFCKKSGSNLHIVSCKIEIFLREF